MGLRLYDTLARELRTFEPLTPGVVGMYVCGPTVQAAPHVGHVRSAIAFDVARRWLEASGYRVVLARNVTDIDDKILHNAGHQDLPWWALASANTRAFTAAYDAVGVLPPTVEPFATGHVPQMVTLIRRLIDAGHAYAAGGDVYFAVRSWPGYGRLSGQRVEDVQQGEATGAKRDPADFALWKAGKPGEPEWETPWGSGRPGWHVECSAMATTYLGPTFDIHGGGLDLLFPHHENELAQSAAAGDGCARWWLHNGLLQVATAKMGKSAGNSLVVADVLARARPQALRYYLAAPHYRSTLEWSEEGLAEADAAYGRVENFARYAAAAAPPHPPGSADPPESAAASTDATWTAFAEAMDDDLAVPRALGVVHGAVREGNAALAAGDAVIRICMGDVDARLARPPSTELR